MVYLHCGWPKTGTTSLQAELVRDEDRLRRRGIVYPREWRREVDGSHNDLIGVLRASRERSGPLDEFKRFLIAMGDEDVLLSSESLTHLGGWDTQEALPRFFAAIQEVTKLKSVWCLRRFDEVIVSLYLQMAANGRRPPPADDFIGNFPTDHVIANMNGARSAVAIEPAYIKYDRGGSHVERLLRACGVPADLTGDIGRALNAAPRLLASRSRKQVVALANVGAVGERMGVPLDRETLSHAFDRDGFRFEDDCRCVPASDGARRSLHERMLESARRHNFEPYVEFFADEKIAGAETALSLDIDVLGDEDLSHLSAHLAANSARQPARAGGG